MDATTAQPESPDSESAEDRALREQIEARRAKREQREAAEAERPSRDGRDLIEAVALNDSLRDDEVTDALDWFLSDDDEDYNYTLKLNVGTPSKEKWIRWTIKPVDLDTLRKIRKDSQGGNRMQRRRNTEPGEIDEVAANLRIVIEGTVAPDMKEISREMNRPPEEALRIRFARKPGLLGQIAGEIMGISGYDDEDVREIESAAGNA